MVMLLDSSESKDKIREYMDSHEWWVLPLVTEESSLLSAEIEERFYDGAANDDFHATWLPIAGLVAVIFANKRRMSAQQLAELLIEHKCFPDGTPVSKVEKTCLTQDVIVPITFNEDFYARVEAAYLKMEMIDEWLYS